MITVLYVDADPKMWKILSHIFEQYCPVSVFPAGSGEEALGWLSQYHADVIVSENNLPGMSGLEFHNVLRSRGFSIPFIFFSESSGIHLKKDPSSWNTCRLIPRRGLKMKSIMDLLRMICWAAGGHEMTELPFRVVELKRDERLKITDPERSTVR